MAFDLAGQRFLVTGGAGFIGRHLVRHLSRAGAVVRILSRNPEQASAFVPPGTEIAPGDLSDYSSLERAVERCSGVVHLAGALNTSRSLAYYREVNVTGTRRIADAAERAGVSRFLHVSSVAVYGLHQGRKIDEASPLEPDRQSFYALTKADAQREILRLTRRGLPGIVVQPSQVYGPGDPTWTLQPLDLMRRRLFVFPSGGRGLLQPIYVDDLAEGFLQALRLGRIGETYILSSEPAVTVRAFFGYHAQMAHRLFVPSVPALLARQTARALEIAARLRGREPLFNRSAVSFATTTNTFSAEKARAELQFSTPTPLSLGMSRVADELAGRDLSL